MIQKKGQSRGKTFLLTFCLQLSDSSLSPNCWLQFVCFFFFFHFIYFILFFLFFNFTILYWFCHMSTWIRHRYTRVPHPEASSLLPPHTIPLGCPSAPAPSIQYGALNLDWQLVSYMILYMFQCHSPKSSQSLPLPQSPKDCSIHQCLFCCLVYRVIIVFISYCTYRMRLSHTSIVEAANPQKSKFQLLSTHYLSFHVLIVSLTSSLYFPSLRDGDASWVPPIFPFFSFS